LPEVKGGARVAFEDELGVAEEREVLCEAQQGRSGVKRKLFGSFRNKMGDVRTFIIEEAHATKYPVRPGAEIGESKMIGLEMEQETTQVVVIMERLKEAKDRAVHFGKKGELAPRRDAIVKVNGNSKSNYELAWVWEDLMKDKYP
nr:hypothetical protein [Tanacetum cinerariifolium]